MLFSFNVIQVLQIWQQMVSNREKSKYSVWILKRFFSLIDFSNILNPEIWKPPRKIIQLSRKYRTLQKALKRVLSKFSLAFSLSEYEMLLYKAFERGPLKLWIPFISLYLLHYTGQQMRKVLKAKILKQLSRDLILFGGEK